MSEGQSEHHGKNEIIIVKHRHGGDHEEHHGGVWKIAYADFMTAMMAFFLVMWLVNAANEETKASVASYFNPIKLMDERPTDRGIRDAADSQDGEAQQPKSKTEGQETSSGDAGADAGKEKNSTAGEEDKYSEADYFENPFSVLAEIAQETGQQTNVSTAGEGGAQTSGPATGASGGEAYRDPFDPDFWTQQIETVEGDPVTENNIADPLASETQTDVQSDTIADPAKPAPAGVAETMPDSNVSMTEGAASKGGGPTETALNMAAEMAGEDNNGGRIGGDPAQMAGKSDKDGEKPLEMAALSDGADAADGKSDKKAEAEAKALREAIAKDIGGVVGKLAEGLSVKPAEGGLLVSLTDQAESGMFNIGSAVPSRDMVLAMEKIGKILEERGGSVVIRGHTDARPFASGDYDNWRLSTARAQSAYYMLVRGGLDEQRIVQVSGFADRRPALPDDPLASANRRIEILVESSGAR